MFVKILLGAKIYQNQIGHLAVVIQTWIRSIQHQQSFWGIKRSTAIIQTWRRKCMGRKREITRIMAASMIQRVSRGLRGRRVAHRRIQALRSIQNKSRSWLNRRTYLCGIRAIITLQASFRRRKSVTKSKQLLLCVTVIQKSWRAYSVNTRAATIIQRGFRSFANRYRYQAARIASNLCIVNTKYELLFGCFHLQLYWCNVHTEDMPVDAISHKQHARPQ